MPSVSSLLQVLKGPLLSHRERTLSLSCGAVFRFRGYHLQPRLQFASGVRCWPAFAEVTLLDAVADRAVALQVTWSR